MEVVLVDVMVVGGSVVVEASGSAAPAVQAERISPSATNLAIVVRIRASLESGGRLSQVLGSVDERASPHLQVREGGLGLVDRKGKLDAVGVSPENVDGLDVDPGIGK